MNIYDLSNKDLASTLELIARNEATETICVYGFSDNRDTRYKAPRFIQEAASRLAKMDDENECDSNEEVAIGKPTKTEEVVQKPEEETEPSTVEILKQAVKMLAEAGRRESKSPMAYDTYGKVIELMRKLDREKQA